eukprot:1161650-Pelagomonas_calceolata.AAC.4
MQWVGLRKEHDRHSWLEDHGTDVDGEYKPGCKRCEIVFIATLAPSAVHVHARDAGLLASPEQSPC